MAGPWHYHVNMIATEGVGTAVLRCDLRWEDVREVMATSRLLVVMRRSWMFAGVMFAGLLAEAIVLLRAVALTSAQVISGSLMGAPGSLLPRTAR